MGMGLHILQEIRPRDLIILFWEAGTFRVIAWLAVTYILMPSLRRFIPDVLKKLLAFDHHPSILPLELLDQIIDHLYDDKPTLLTLGLVSKQTLVRSRGHLFSKLEFSCHNYFDTLVTKQNFFRTTKLKCNDGNRQFDAFLSLLEAPWTTFTFTVEFLHINNLFWHPTTGYRYCPNRNIPRIAARLPNLKSLWLTSIAWICVPPHIQEFFFQLNVADLQLDCIEFEPTYPNDFVELFSRFQSSVKTLTLYNIVLDDIPDLSKQHSIFHRRFRFKSLDSHSLVFFVDVWDPSVTNDLDIAVESFHLRLDSLTQRERELYTPFISRFLQCFGQSVHRLFINISGPYLCLGKPIQVYHINSWHFRYRGFTILWICGPLTMRQCARCSHRNHHIRPTVPDTANHAHVTFSFAIQLRGRNCAHVQTSNGRRGCSAGTLFLVGASRERTKDVPNVEEDHHPRGVLARQ